MAENRMMSDSERAREFEGKTVDLAVKAASRFFEMDPEELEVEIVTKGSTGIFGLGGRSAIVKAAPKVVAAAPEETAPPVVEEEAEGRPEYMELARETISEILSLAGLEGDVAVKPTDEGFCLDISGDDVALIIGKEGQTLDALEYIVNRIMARKYEKSVRIFLDAQGYRRKREEQLIQLASRKAEKVKKLGRPISLQYMEPRERRTVHLALKDMDGIRTYSVGEGAVRKVVIAPQRNARGAPDRKKHNRSRKRQ